MRATCHLGRELNLPIGLRLCRCSTAAAARQPGSTLARGTRFRFVASLEEANERVTDLATSPRHDSHNMHVHHQDAQFDRAVLQAHVASLEREA
ncbi:hypothetical protein Tco_0097003 [Tanacetum coccineum]